MEKNTARVYGIYGWQTPRFTFSAARREIGAREVRQRARRGSSERNGRSARSGFICFSVYLTGSAAARPPFQALVHPLVQPSLAPTARPRLPYGLPFNLRPSSSLPEAVRSSTCAHGGTATAAAAASGRGGGSAGHHDERDCPFRLANTGAIGFLSAATAAAGCRAPVARNWHADFSRILNSEHP
ncbi:hypothetical protein PUN28_005080 [Cardiocondyla obscurior]|uniref:Uncharacterized protein n=1 Tax=Cardiocondyla obscurior TaxID=286306 RepID=A0AAW2GFX1_9HYME